ncbi:DDRGK domain-containing protein 1 [Phlebotomus papatasi]|uniref:DDRGK domain-containing protein 1 n=1 Tax=Phlebotomus papatasi TaxID=29031 RepID=UPI002483AA2E|nr:DDRGK domain-containing protein 1 [Phlebotomus papatasi]
MDLYVLIGIAGSLLVILLTTLFFLRKGQTEKTESGNQGPARRGVPVRVQEGVPRRAQLARNQRNRLRQTNVPEQAAEDDVEEEAAGDDERPMPDFSGEKMGTKKRAKLEAKAEKKAQREAELRLREEKKKKEAVQEEERRKLEEKEREEEKAREEAEKKAQEERERKEYEEYLKLKASFDVEEEGFEEGDEDQENLLREFVQYIQQNKVVVLEDLATHFKLKTQAVIDRITDLKSSGSLTGVIDDRGKFIHISDAELQAVAKFIKQRGRVSIAELAESSNTLINLVPVS